MSDTIIYRLQRYFSCLCFCCPCCKPRSLLQHQVTGGDEDWGLNYDDTGNVRVSKELESKPSEIEAVNVDTFNATDENSSNDVNESSELPGDVKVMKASSGELVSVRGKDGWSKYKSTNLNTEEADEIDSEVNENEVTPTFLQED